MSNLYNKSFVIKLSKYITGSIDANELIRGQKYIEDIYEKNPRGNSILRFEIDWNFFSNEFFEDGDDYFVKMVTNTESDWDLWSVDDLIDEYWGDGFIQKFFNKENIEIYNSIIKKLLSTNPNNLNSSFESSEAGKVFVPNEMNRVILNSYGPSISPIIELFIDLKNRESQLASKDALEKETLKVFGEEGINVNWEYSYIEITAGKLYEILRVENYTAEDVMNSIVFFMKEIADSKQFHGWEEDKWEFEDPKYFNNLQFNKIVSQVLGYIDKNLYENINPDYFSIITLLSQLNKSSFYETVRSYHEKSLFRVTRLNAREGTVTVKILDNPMNIPNKTFPGSSFNFNQQYEMDLERFVSFLKLNQLIS